MKRKFFSIVVLLLIGYSLGTISVINTKANSNVVLASVEWVLSLITPMEEKLNELEQRIANLENGDQSNEPITYSHIQVNKSTAVRRSASDSDTVFFTAPAGTSLEYESTYTNKITGSKWYIVKLSDNRLGAIKANDASLKTTALTSFTKVVVNKNSSVKRGADNSYSDIYQAKASETLIYNSTFTNKATGAKWYIVKVPSGQLGAIPASNAEVVR